MYEILPCDVERVIGAAGAVALSGVAACSADEETTADTDTTTSVADPFTAVEEGVLPETVPAGTKLTIENNAETELHELVAMRIADEETRPPAVLLELPEQELLAVAGPNPTTVLLAPPGEPQVAALGDGTLAEPGRYLLPCAIPTRVDPAEYLAAAAESAGPPDVDGGPPHFTHGMFAELTVE